MDLSVLDQLKEKLINAKEFKDVMNAFFDIAETPEFMDYGQKVDDPQLKSMVEACGKVLFGPSSKLQDFLPVHIDSHHFTHAGGIYNGRLISAIYFDDIDKGLVAMLGGGGITHFARITKKNAPPNFQEMN